MVPGADFSSKKTRKRDFLEEMEKVLQWARLMQVVEPHYPKVKTDRLLFLIETMRQIHDLQRWFGLSDSAREDAPHDFPLLRKFYKLDGTRSRLPIESTLLHFRNLLEGDDLASDRSVCLTTQSNYRY